MSAPVKLTFLGTGTSQGVPVIACDCEVCASSDPKDKRLRSSVLIETQGKTFVIDTGPDFRQQMLRAGVKHLDAVLFTHSHKDHVAGMDDIRAFNFQTRKPMKVYADKLVQEALRREFYYVFENNKYPGVPSVELITISNSAFSVDGVGVTPIDVMHYKMPVKAFRIGDLTYITDASHISDEELEKVEGSKVVVVNALRKQDHISHFTLDEAVRLIHRLNPEMGYLTHISHLMGKHEDVSKELPDNVKIAHDGLAISVQ